MGLVIPPPPIDTPPFDDGKRQIFTSTWQRWYLKLQGTFLLVGSVTSVSVAAANGFTGSVANPTSTPAISIGTSVTGLLKGNGAGVSAATAGTDYSAGTSALATGILKSTTATGALSIAVAGDFPTLNQNTSGSAGTLNPGRTINGTLFDGSANIVITAVAAAGTLTGTTLAANVVSSSLTGVGTITTGVWNAGALTSSGNCQFSTTQNFSWVAKTVNTAYQAASDGFVVFYSRQDASNWGYYDGLTDASNPPTTARSAAGLPNNTGGDFSMTFPVRKGDYYKVLPITTAGFPTNSLWWAPLGVNG